LAKTPRTRAEGLQGTSVDGDGPTEKKKRREKIGMRKRGSETGTIGSGGQIKGVIVLVR